VRGLPIVLANPRDPAVSIEHYITYENLGIAYIAAALRQEGFSAAIVDAYARQIGAAEAAAEVATARPALVGLTATYQSLGEAYEMARLIKAAVPGAHVCMGGEHATYSARAILGEEPAIDSICRGEGERTMVDLARKLPDGDLGSVLGLTFRDGPPGAGAAAGAGAGTGAGAGAATGAVIRENPPRPPIADLDAVAFPVRDTLEWCTATDRHALIGLLGSRGCAYDCHFCNAFDYFRSGIGPAWRKRSPKKIVDELEMLCNRYYNRSAHEPIHFYDANFVYPTPAGREWAGAIAEEIISRKLELNFAVYCRADSFTDGDEEFATLLARAGLRSAFIGLEAASQEMLDRYHKRTSVEQNRWVLSFLRAHGVETVTNGFIMFSPYSSLADVRANGRFLLDTGQASFWNLTGRLQLFPGVKLVDALRRDGLLLPTYAHQRIHDYNFTDPKVALLVDRLDFGDHPAPARENHLVRYIRMVHFEIEQRLAARARDGRPLPGPAAVHAVTLDIEKARRVIDQTNHDFFVASVDLAEAGWDEPRFQAMRAEYLDGFEARLDDLLETFNRYLDAVDRAVEADGASVAAGR